MDGSAVVRQAKSLVGAAAARVCAFVHGPGARMRLLALFGVLASLAVLAAGSAFIGYWAGENDVAGKIQRRYIEPALAPYKAQPDEVEVAWRTVNTNRQQLQVASFEAESNLIGMAWALAPVGDNLVFAAVHGQLSYLDTQNRVAPLNLDVPMRLPELWESDVFQNPVFELNQVRTFDLLAVETAPQQYDLYASYSRYGDDCFDLAVSRTPLEVTSAGVQPKTGVWEEIYVANPCLPFKTTGMVYAGHEGGGRLALKDPDTLLLSVGVFQFDNVALGQLGGQDPSTDLGKIIAISLSTKQARPYAVGFRNPQGLLVTRNGEVWETEHGPQGGDEVNHIVEGGNYGWPFATYGMDYGSPPKPWPFSDAPGSHEGYDEPAYVFTPSIGISNIVEVDERQFPGWKGDFVAASLLAGSLYALHREGDVIVSAEPIHFDDRLRDIVTMPDGRIAMASDAGDIIFLRNGSAPHADASFTVSGLTALPTPPEEVFSGNVEGRFQRGARRFQYACGSCHSLTGEVKIGPPLNGMFDRPIASFEGYGYSEALRSHDGPWTPGLFRSFITNPAADFAGTIMPPVDEPNDSLNELIDYLRSTEALPQPS